MTSEVIKSFQTTREMHYGVMLPAVPQLEVGGDFNAAAFPDPVQPRRPAVELDSEDLAGALAASLEGTVKRITFRAADTGYSVVRVKTNPGSSTGPSTRVPAVPSAVQKDKPKKLDGGMVTVVGILPLLQEGQQLRFKG
jgi:hypothetical protein